jgi:hypothetical protein
MTHWMGWFELVAEEALLVIAFLVIFDGLRRLVRDGFSRGTATLVAVALVLPVWEASQSLKVIRSVQLLQAQKMAALSQHGREPAGGWEKAPLTPDARMRMSFEAATINYMFQGSRLDVIDANGGHVLFVPTPEESRAREQFVRDEKGAEATAQSMYERGLRLFVGTAGFLLAGLAVGWRQRRRA